MKKIPHIIFLLSLLSLLTACGFSLRGNSTVELAEQLQVLQVQANNGNSDIYRATVRALNANGIQVIDEAETNTYQLNLGREELSERVVSINSNARAGEYELTMSVPLQLSSASETVIDEVLSVERTYLADPNNAVAKSEESRIIQNEMRQAVVRQVLLRLQNLSF